MSAVVRLLYGYRYFRIPSFSCLKGPGTRSLLFLSASRLTQSRQRFPDSFVRTFSGVRCQGSGSNANLHHSVIRPSGRYGANNEDTVYHILCTVRSWKNPAQKLRRPHSPVLLQGYRSFPASFHPSCFPPANRCLPVSVTVCGSAEVYIQVISAEIRGMRNKSYQFPAFCQTGHIYSASVCRAAEPILPGRLCGTVRPCRCHDP